MDRNKDRQPDAPESEEVEDFGALFETSLKTIKPGEVVRGHVVQVTRDYVTVDIGYKSEGQIPIHEFMTRDGEVEVSEGDEVDVYFDSSEGDNGGIALSRSRAEQLKVWTDIERAFQSSSTVEGTIVGKVKGGLKVDRGERILTRLARGHPPRAEPRPLHRSTGQVRDPEVQPVPRQRGRLASHGDGARA
jgi:small subunit ribosomal protein S1